MCLALVRYDFGTMNTWANPGKCFKRYAGIVRNRGWASIRVLFVGRRRHRRQVARAIREEGEGGLTRKRSRSMRRSRRRSGRRP